MGQAHSPPELGSRASEAALSLSGGHVCPWSATGHHSAPPSLCRTLLPTQPPLAGDECQGPAETCSQLSRSRLISSVYSSAQGLISHGKPLANGLLRESSLPWLQIALPKQSPGILWKDAVRFGMTRDWKHKRTLINATAQRECCDQWDAIEKTLRTREAHPGKHGRVT